MKNMRLSRNKQPTKKEPCAWCQRLRILLSVLVLTLAMLALNGELRFLRGVSLTLIAAKAVGLGFIILVIWKAYKEYWKPHNARTEKKP